MQLSSILARSVAGHQAANLGGLPKAVVDLLNSLKLQANGDAFATGEGLSFSFTGSDLLGNDGGVTKSLVSVQATSASGATITSAGGVFSYDPGVRFDWLGAGETALDSFSYTIRNAAGQTSTATVTVTGENAPVLFDDPLPAVAQMSELTRNEDHPDGDGAIHLVSGAFGFHDADLSDLHFGLSIDPHGDGYVGSFNLPEFTDGLGAGTVGWSFQLQEWEIDYLAEGETLTQSYDVTIADIHGSTATKTVSVEIAGRNDAPVAEALSGTVRAWGSSSFRPSDVSFAPLFMEWPAPFLHHDRVAIGEWHEGRSHSWGGLGQEQLQHSRS